jgi:hypothetical protein
MAGADLGTLTAKVSIDPKTFAAVQAKILAFTRSLQGLNAAQARVVERLRVLGIDQVAADTAEAWRIAEFLCGSRTDDGQQTEETR